MVHNHKAACGQCERDAGTPVPIGEFDLKNFRREQLNYRPYLPPFQSLGGFIVDECHHPHVSSSLL